MKLFYALAATAFILAGCDTSLQEDSLAAMTDTELVKALDGLQPGDLPSTVGCRTAQVWVKINPSLVPRTLSDLREVPTGIQRAALETLEPELQARVWQQHLSEAADELTRPQARELIRIQRVVTPEWLVEVDQLSETDRIERIEREIGSPEELSATFGDMAPMLFTSIRSTRAVLGDRSASVGSPDVTPLLAEEEGCTCAQNSDWCGMRGHNSDCQSHTCETGGKCGTLWRHSCNGECLPD